MQVFIFGAGASLHVRYPLASHLGRTLVDWAERNPRPKYFYWIDPDQLRTIFSSLDDFEGIITELEDPTLGSRVSTLPAWERGSILAGFRNALCEFFESIRANDAWLYRRFANGVIQPGDIVISFNYDVSLERELRRAGKWEISDGYGFDLGVALLPPSPIKLLKLHGSTNWIDLLFDGARPDSTRVYLDALGRRPVILPPEFDFLGYSGIRDPRFNGGGVDWSGSMILPGRLKRFDVRASFWNALWEQAGTALQKADEIVIVGYSLFPADERARELVFSKSNRSSNLTICCKDDNDRLEKELLQAGFTRIRTDLKCFGHWLTAAQEGRDRAR